MRKLILLLLAVNLTSFAQESLFIGEFCIDVKRNYDEKTITLHATLVSDACWDAKSGSNFHNWHPLTTQYPGGNSSQSWSGATLGKVCLDLCYHRQDATPFLGLGKYKITVKEDGVAKDFMYIDYRTSHLPEIFASPDIFFDYDAEAEKLYYSNTTTDVISETIWNMLTTANLITTEFEPGKPESFSLSSYNNHPFLTWNHSALEEDYWTGYAVYRSVRDLNEPPGTFVKIADLNKYTTSYTDTQLETGNFGTVYYKVAAVNGNRESVHTGVKNINYAPPKQGVDENPLTFSLNQNYPNPFNPVTTINYSIPGEEHVTLKIYDMSGKEVLEFVNQRKEAGQHSINFNGANLSSGVYIYTITAGKYSDTKKLVLVK